MSQDCVEIRKVTDIKLSNFSLKEYALFFEYYKEYYGDNFTDLTFIITKGANVLGYILCNAVNGILTLPDGGIIIKLIESITEKERKQLYQKILVELESLAANNNCTNIVIKDNFSDGSISVLGQELFNNRFQARLTFEMLIDYKKFVYESFYSNLRKSYKSLVNWGKKNLDTVFINKKNLCKKSFDEFQKFHHKISGRKTRSDKTWETQYEMLKNGIGELIIARYHDELVAGSLFADYGDITIYFTGVYERKLFEFGLSHFLLYTGICRSYERKNTDYFSIGYFDTDIKDPKWYNIQYFKKGFCKNLKPTIFWSKKIK